MNKKKTDKLIPRWLAVLYVSTGLDLLSLTLHHNKKVIHLKPQVLHQEQFLSEQSWFLVEFSFCFYVLDFGLIMVYFGFRVLGCKSPVLILR